MNGLPAAMRFGEPRCVWPAGAELGEGTCWSVRAQALWWVDILGGRLHRFHPQTDARRSWPLGEPVSAVAERRGGGLALTLRRGFAFFDPETGTLDRRDSPEADRPGNRFNDGKCDPAGRFWGGTMDFDARAPTGALYRFDAAGRVDQVLELGFPVTNGPTWSADGRTMYVNDTVRGDVHAFDFDPASGTPSGQRVWLHFDAGHPDGMTTDADGRIWIAHWGGGCVSAHDPRTAAELLRLALPAPHVTNLAFGGPRLRTLYVTTARAGLDAAALAAAPLSGGLFAIDGETAGLPAALHG